ncbi:MAG: hypothetical protein EZS28_024595 [Streblomastix strix]|uniref:Uncharacterized protein n=1 Tax=Streblomastix strix TaxID=222440 RepID=A0A5J4VBG9_9EUKA|nr:MAG: hypothetical protein EZS28_024591 [Streblomastix strix]KAA6379883.1 MAG: hypothetical protein EZS28_024595 [Streblomastix strix]
MLNQNENQALEQNQEIQIRSTHNDMPPPNSGPRDQSLPGKDDEGQYWPGFGPGVPHATDWGKSKYRGQIPSMDEIRAFWRQNNFDLKVACVKKKYNSENDSETLQPAKTTRQEFRNRFGRHRNRSLSSHNKRLRYDSPDRRCESRERS